MGGGKAPEDKSAEVARIETQAAREAQQAQDEKDRQKQAQFDTQLEGAFGTGIAGGRDYFLNQGLDPDVYEPRIRQKATQLRGQVPNLAANPGSYFADLGQMLYDELQGAERNRDLAGIDKFAPAGFSSKRIADTADDDLIEAILQEQRTPAEGYAQNLKSRGVITGGGFDAAMKNIKDQMSGARSRLGTVSSGILNEGRSGAENLIAGERSRAANQRLGDQFDPFATGQDLENYFSKFFSGFNDKVRGVAPTDLFSTSGIPGIAGAAQGAQNTPFNPKALSGVFDDDEEDENQVAEASPF
jgi:hypothetical protein